MEKYRVEGFVPSSFTGKDGREVSGFWLYVSLPLRSPGSGRKFERYFVTPRMLSGGMPPDVGSTVILLFNRYGKISSVSVSVSR